MKQHKTLQRHPSKVRPVPVKDMRVPPALVNQRPFDDRWCDCLLANFDPDKIGVPIVNYRSGIYWIMDGQHRIEAIKRWFAPSDPGTVPCQVYEDLTDAEMADKFLGHNETKTVTPFVKFNVACTAEYQRECDIRRTVECQGLKIGREREQGRVSAVGALGRVYDKSGSLVLGQVLRTIRDAWEADPVAFDGRMIEALGLTFNRYNGRTDEKSLASALAHVQQGVLGVMRRAESLRERTGHNKTQCIAATVIDIYNKQVPRPKRLPSWWKDAE